MKKYANYRDIPEAKVHAYADAHDLNIQSPENYRMAAIELFEQMGKPKPPLPVKKGPKKTVSFKIDQDIIDGLDKIRERGKKTAIVEAGIKTELVKQGYLDHETKESKTI